MPGLSPASGESMLTGSPPSGSYVSPTDISFGNQNARFLPPFLLGSTQQSSPGSARKYQSRLSNGINPVSQSPPGHHHVTWSPDLIQRIPPTPSSGAAHSSVSRFGGPPVKSLITSGDQASRMDSFNSIPLERLDSSNLSACTFGRNMSASQIDPFYTQGDDFDPSTDLDSTWVTVFGFTPEAANFILKEFSTYGTIIQHEFASKGNWVHIKYQSPLQARKALSKNGHLYAQNTIRVGVTPCIDKEVMRRYPSKNARSPLELTEGVNSKRFKGDDLAARRLTQPPVSGLRFSQFDTSTPVRSSPLATFPRLDQSTVNGSSMNGVPRSTRLGSMRSLAAPYENGHSSSAPNKVGQPQVDNDAGGSLLTKAWKYLFSS